MDDQKKEIEKLNKEIVEEAPLSKEEIAKQLFQGTRRAPPKALAIIKETRHNGKMRDVLAKILHLPADAIPWKTAKHLRKVLPGATMADLMHLKQIEVAVVDGSTAAYNAVMDRAEGKVPNMNLNIDSNDYRSFLEDCVDNKDSPPKKPKNDFIEVEACREFDSEDFEDL